MLEQIKDVTDRSKYNRIAVDTQGPNKARSRECRDLGMTLRIFINSDAVKNWIVGRPVRIKINGQARIVAAKALGGPDSKQEVIPFPRRRKNNASGNKPNANHRCNL